MLESLKVMGFVLVNPLKAFRIVKDKYGFKIYFLPALLILIGVILYTVVVGPLEAEFGQMILRERLKEMSPEQARAIEMQLENNPLGSSSVMLIFGLVFGVLGQVVYWPFISAIYLLLAMIMRERINFSQTLTVVVVSSLPLLVKSIIEGTYVAISGRYIAYPGLSGLVVGDQLTNVLSPLALTLSRIDIFIIWYLIVLAIGFTVACRVPKIKSAIMVIAVWILGTIVTVIPGVLGSLALGG
ncbi:YIP1 family protein [Candidatus Hakubella thermalkaliphila]|uniref:Yip1 domain-containing protein n=1 Tax=Candidatus Hakubella thermalkaliphila TaxID=2754717 RepID=A0A6V8QAP2_9ACTN|nr:YIP1 family protein [Candidatus Hakubella thermalkaliphila]GFP29107.1 hypothetical protein HKBW3S34_00025 [Candidatus Hakubella thermalkaliphila]GFP38372.1 hypothetical protein HKBW3S47_00073 [Candidatus Hakubella thermalkaliphila]GFP41673.1 hypothetical protein HKBW3C_00798 [Candidatus Hakubella thermalkaliphila]